MHDEETPRASRRARPQKGKIDGPSEYLSAHIHAWLIEALDEDADKLGTTRSEILRRILTAHYEGRVAEVAA